MSASKVYLLAAGRGRRAGGPKAWLEYRGTTLLERQITFLTRRFPPGDIAVTVQEAWMDRCRGLHPDVRWVPEDPESSALHALQTLLRRVPYTGRVFFFHVDMPVWHDEVFDRLEEGPISADAVVPVYKGRGGHPVLLSQDLRAAAAALDPRTSRLDHFLKTRNVERLEVAHAAIGENWNERKLQPL